MSIDWQKAEEKPEKKQSVEGRFLLDLRAKVNDLEKQLSETKSELSQVQEKLKTTTLNLENTVSELNSTKTTLESTKNELEQARMELEKTKAEYQAIIDSKEQKINEIKTEMGKIEPTLQNYLNMINASRANLKQQQKQNK